MSFWDTYNKRLNLPSDSIRENKIDSMKSYMRRKIESDPSFFTLDVLEPSASATCVKRFNLVNEKYTKGTNPNKIYYISHPDDTVEMGSIVYGLYDSTWMVLTSQNLAGITDRGILHKINWTAKWLIDGTIYSSPAVITTTSQLDDGIDSNAFLVVPNSSIVLVFPKNASTEIITRNQRLMAYGIPYKVSKIDAFTSAGLYYMVAIEDQLADDDNVELDICNYVEPITEKLAISGTDRLSYGETATYTVYNIATGESLDSLYATSSELGMLSSEIDMDAGTITLTVANNSDYVGTVVTIGAVSDTGRTAEFVLTISSLM